MAQRHGEVAVTAYQGHAAHGEQTWASIQADRPQLCVAALCRAMFKRLTAGRSHHTLQSCHHTQYLMTAPQHPCNPLPDLRVKKGEFQKETHKSHFPRSNESQTKMPFGPALARENVCLLHCLLGTMEEIPSRGTDFWLSL